MIQKEDIKAFARSKGAVKCGIATIDRFINAPKGFHPPDIYPKAKSVVVYLLKMPDDTVFATNPLPYTITAGSLNRNDGKTFCNDKSYYF